MFIAEDKDRKPRERLSETMYGQEILILLLYLGYLNWRGCRQLADETECVYCHPRMRKSHEG